MSDDNRCQTKPALSDGGGAHQASKTSGVHPTLKTRVAHPTREPGGAWPGAEKQRATWPFHGCRSMRGQAWTLDFTMGLMALVFILLFYMLMWDTLTLRWALVSQRTQMEASALFASESLMATPGEPESWEMLPEIDGNVSAIGLVNGRNELNRMKLEKLVAENATAYSTVKARLGMQRYEFGMRITDLEDNEVYYTFGKFSGHGFNNSLNFDRFGMLDSQPVIVHMEVWGR